MYASYKVAAHVRSHQAFGLGVHGVLPEAPIIAADAFVGVLWSATTGA